MTHIEKVKQIREATLSPINKINAALVQSNGDVDEALKILRDQMSQSDLAGLENRVANAKIVYSYVHNNRVSATVVLACQTDFVAKNEIFLNLAKDLCIQIISAPINPHYVDRGDVPGSLIETLHNDELRKIPANKPDSIKLKIIEGKLEKFYKERCLLEQAFVKNEDLTIRQLIQSVVSQVGEKIEVKKFIKITAND